MKIQITGKHTDIGEAFTQYIQETLQTAMQKYFADPVDAHIIIEKKGHQFHTEITSHVCHGFDVVAKGHDFDPYTSFDMAVSRIKTRLTRYKDRLKDRRHSAENLKIEMAQKYVFDGLEKIEQETHPTIIAEMKMEIPTFSVGDAVMQMDLKDLPVVLFKNPLNNQINIVFRRQDGNIGWVDPNNLSENTI
ncbi:MAG: ribosome-associated translation inhibitor RaiA [Candidatus Paracaedibacteraceae bacterium]|nr:ribosome-associated translation inhibitor RaiA [Candidatus Paracaedibacteraceae bacterium]